MTDEQIMQVLKMCNRNSCDIRICPYAKDTIGMSECVPIMTADVYEYVSRLKAEAEKLNIELQAMRGTANSYKAELEKVTEEKDRLIKTYAECQVDFLKEFAHRLKILMETKAVLLNLRNDFAYSDDCVFAIVQSTALSTIDNLVKEMGCGE